MPPKGKSLQVKTNKVYKAILDTPYVRPEWPIISEEDVKNIVDSLELMFAGEQLRLKYFCMGFNNTNEAAEESPETLACIFVCRSDIDIPLVTSHFPLLCGVTKIKLIQLPSGSASRLAKACNQVVDPKRSVAMADTSVFALKKPANSSDIPGASLLLEIIAGVPTVEIPWHEHKTVVKSIRTTAGIAKKQRKLLGQDVKVKKALKNGNFQKKKSEKEKKP